MKNQDFGESSSKKGHTGAEFSGKSEVMLRYSQVHWHTGVFDSLDGRRMWKKTRSFG